MFGESTKESVWWMKVWQILLLSHYCLKFGELAMICQIFVVYSITLYIECALIGVHNTTLQMVAETFRWIFH